MFGGIDVPDAYFLPVVGWLPVGDGSIVNFVHAPTKRPHPNYGYERLMAQFTSASRKHLEWWRHPVEPLLRTRGHIEVTPPKPPRHEFNVTPVREVRKHRGLRAALSG
jgi:hypothetical protein